MLRCLVCAVITVFLCSQTVYSCSLNTACWAWGFFWSACFCTSWDILPSALRSAAAPSDRPRAAWRAVACRRSRRTEARSVVALAGPAVNLFHHDAGAPPLVMAGVDLGEMLLSPLDPRDLFSRRSLAGRAAVDLLDQLPVPVDLFPAFPLDGGYALAAVLRPVFGDRSGGIDRRFKRDAGRDRAFGHGAVTARGHAAVPTWLPLSLFAIFLFFSGKQHIGSWRPPQPDETLLGYDFSEGYTSLERSIESPRTSTSSLFGRWIEHAARNRRRRTEQIEADEERQSTRCWLD